MSISSEGKGDRQLLVLGVVIIIKFPGIIKATTEGCIMPLPWPF